MTKAVKAAWILRLYVTVVFLTGYLIGFLYARSVPSDTFIHDRQRIEQQYQEYAPYER